MNHTFHAGRLTHASQGVLTAIFPQAQLGAIVQVERVQQAPLLAEIVGIHDERCTLAPWSDPSGLRAGATVQLLGSAAPLLSEQQARGCVVNALGDDLLRGGSVTQTHANARPTTPFRDRLASRTRVHAGIRSVDMLLPIVQGQRIGIFAGAGVGKTTLLTQLAHQVDADRVVIALIGERAREAVSLAEELRGLSSWERMTLIVATSDDPAALRVRAAWAAMEIAQQVRAEGQHVLVLIDSLTRWVRARRDLSLLAGERAARGGFPPSAFAAMAPLIEAAGADQHGAITAFFTVLLEADAMEDPIGDEARGLVEAHWILSRSLAQRHVFPAIDLRSSLSRLASDALNDEQQRVYRRLRHAFALAEELQEAQRFGLYTPGMDPQIDAVHACLPAMLQWMRQATDCSSSWADTLATSNALAQQLSALG